MKDKKVYQVKGSYSDEGEVKPFIGSIQLEKREHQIFYTWKLETTHGEFLSSVSRPVSFRIIPDESDPFHFALEHAIKGINKYRVSRKASFQISSIEEEI